MATGQIHILPVQCEDPHRHCPDISRSYGPPIPLGFGTGVVMAEVECQGDERGKPSAGTGVLTDSQRVLRGLAVTVVTYSDYYKYIYYI